MTKLSKIIENNKAKNLKVVSRKFPDPTLVLAVGLAANSKMWSNKKLKWSRLVERLKQPVRTSETLKEYAAATREERGKIKDVGGYVGGYLRGSRRKPENVQNRYFIVLDIDEGFIGFWEEFILTFNFAAFIHTTHSHTDDKPKYRLVIPINRSVNPDEFQAISRWVAGELDIAIFDPTTFQTSRLMFWPSISKDAEYYWREQKGELLDADYVLSQYEDWKDVTLWPTIKNSLEELKRAGKKQEDPRDKKGVIGAFCRTYGIHEVIESFLAEKYLKAKGERYTYVNGSTSSGLVVYDNLYAYSNHGSDPASNQLCNAFDLVRLHLYGSLDEGSKATTAISLPSYKKMMEFCMKDEPTKRCLVEEKLASAVYDFTKEIDLDLFGDNSSMDNDDDDDDDDDDLDLFGDSPNNKEPETDWLVKLQMDKSGKFLTTDTNVSLILENDPNLKGLFRLNLFDNKVYLMRSAKWRKINTPEPIIDSDLQSIRIYLGKVYGIRNYRIVEDNLGELFQSHSFHPVRDHLRACEEQNPPLPTDVEELEKLLINVFGCVDNIYTRETAVLFMVACVWRVFEPGVKYDHVLTLAGREKSGKSSFGKTLAGEKWFSAEFSTFQGKEAYEQMQGYWIIEMGELAAMKHSEQATIKHFITKTKDSFRPAFGRTVQEFKRQCVPYATTNESHFLKSKTGNRRFLVIEVRPKKATIYSDEIPQEQINRYWATAMRLYKQWKKEGRKLVLTPEAEKIAEQMQDAYMVEDTDRGIIEAYLNTLLPDTWKDFSLSQRLDYYDDEKLIKELGTVKRQTVCSLEILRECYGINKDKDTKYKAMQISDTMSTIKGWKYAGRGKQKSFKLYGRQRYFKRVE